MQATETYEKVLKIGSVSFVSNEWFDEDNKPRPYNDVVIEWTNEATDHWNRSYEVAIQLTKAEIQSIIDFLQAFQERNKV